MTTDEKIVEYGKTFDVIFMNVDDLIRSHKRLREANKETAEEIRQRCNVAAERAYNAAMDATFVKWEDLSKMTVSEIVERLG